MMGRIQMMSMCNVGVMPCCFVIALFVLLRRFSMMLRSLLVMFCGLLMLFSRLLFMMVSYLLLMCSGGLFMFRIFMFRHIILLLEVMICIGKSPRIRTKNILAEQRGWFHFRP
jgi:hypothetical protein